jgi:hypothetical protein
MSLTHSFKETCGSIWKAAACRQWVSKGRAGRPRSRPANSARLRVTTLDGANASFPAPVIK